MGWIPLPVGVENFEDLIQTGYYFVDKTESKLLKEHREFLEHQQKIKLIQEQKNRLKEYDIIDLLDDKLIFYLKMIFLKEHMNLRNDIAHGFLNLENIEMNPTIYIFILLLLYIIIYENDNYNKNNFL